MGGVPVAGAQRAGAVGAGAQPHGGAAQATLRQAEENYRADYGSQGVPVGQRPARAPAASATRSRRPSGIPAGATANLFQAGLDLSYTLDIVGGNRRELEGVRAAIDYQRFQVEATWLSLTSSVVATAIQEASLRAQLQVTRDVVDNETKSLKVIDAQVQLGALARGALLQQQTLIAQQQAQIPPLEKALAQTRHQLAVLAGRLPGDDGLPAFDIDSLTLPRELPLSVPSALVRQRPDVRASEALLHEASAQIGVATASAVSADHAQRRRRPPEPSRSTSCSTPAPPAGAWPPAWCSRSSTAARCRRRSGPPWPPTTRRRRSTSPRC